jgi:glycosyltransferase involved in cell wall biosynthesis
MRIAFLCTSFPRYKNDGASVFLLNLANALVRMGHRIHVIAPHDSHVDPEWNPEGITFHRFRYSFCSGHLAYGAGIVPNLRSNPLLWMLTPLFLLSMAWKLWCVTRRHHIEMIHAHWIVPAGLVATALHRWHRLPIVETAHGSDIFSLGGHPWEILRRWALVHCNAWTANTASTSEAATANGLPRAHIIPMGVDSDHFGAGNRKRGRGMLDTDVFLILFVGRLIRLKGADLLLKAFSMIEKPKNARLWLVGDGPERIVLEDLSRRLGIEQSVNFMGHIDHDKLPDIYAAADLFVIPSRELIGVGREGQGTVLLEAMAASCPVIGSDSGGIPSVIEHNVTGQLVPPENDTALAYVIQELMDNPNKRRVLANAGQALVKEQYDWSVIAQKFDELYEQVTRNTA